MSTSRRERHHRPPGRPLALLLELEQNSRARPPKPLNPQAIEAWLTSLARAVVHPERQALPLNFRQHATRDHFLMRASKVFGCPWRSLLFDLTVIH